MLAKLKIALVLLLIGSISGALIWGTNALTEDRIALNRERARMANYILLYPDLDVENLDFEVVEFSLVTEKANAFNPQGTLLGYIFNGRHENAFGHVEVIVGIDTQGNIVGVVISNTSNTATYVQTIYDQELLLAFTGLNINELTISYDVKVGATTTYNSVKRIIEAAILLVAGDPILEQYQLLFAEAARYEVAFEYLLGTIKHEMAILDDNNVIIGYVYQGNITVNDTVYIVGFGVDLDEKFVGVTVLDKNAPQALLDALDDFEQYIGEDIDGLLFDLTGTIQESLQQMATLALSRALEDDETRELLNLFEGAAYKGPTLILSAHPILEEATPVYDGDSNLLGYVYEAAGQGYAFYPDPGDPVIPIMLQIVIDKDGVIISVSVKSHGESTDYYERTLDNLEMYAGLSDLNDYDKSIYAGASTTGSAVFNAVKAAQDDLLERVGD